MNGFQVGGFQAGFQQGPAGPGGGGGTGTTDVGATGKLIRVMNPRLTTVTTSWWWLTLLSALGGR